MLLGERDIIDYLAGLFGNYKVGYLLTGSFAGSYWGHPRATHDIDFLVEFKKGQTKNILSFLKNLGPEFMVDLGSAKLALKRNGQFNILHPETTVKIDFWVAKDNEFENLKFKRKIKVKLFDQYVYIVSAEDLVLTKLLWNKQIYSERHMRDCVGILEVQKEKLDDHYLNDWAKKLRVEKLLQQARTGQYFE